MKTKTLVFFAAVALMAPVALIPIRAADSMAPAGNDKPANSTVQKSPNAAETAKADAARKEREMKQELNKRVADAIAFYNALQSRPETAIPNWVVANAKGIIIFERWSVSAGIGGTGGHGIGWKKESPNGGFGAPAFYTIGGASLGPQIGVAKTQTVAFLMSDKALLTLTDNKFLWSGNVRATAGKHSASDSSVDNTVDVLLYQKSSGLDVGAFVAATEVSVDNASNRLFYDNPSLTPTEILAGKVKPPEFTESFLADLKKLAMTKAK